MAKARKDIAAAKSVAKVARGAKKSRTATAGAGKTRAAKANSETVQAGRLSDAALVELARSAIGKRVHAVARVVRSTHALARMRAVSATGGDVDAEVAKLVGAKLPADDAADAAVEFETETPLGKRSTVVHVRGGKVTRVVTRAAR